MYHLLMFYCTIEALQHGLDVALVLHIYFMYFTAVFENGEVFILQRPWARIFHVGADQDVTTTQENAL